MPELSELSPQQWILVGRYIDLVLEHNERTNLTADDSRDLILSRHIADGLPPADFLKKRLADKTAPRLAEIGAGAGFVGIAVKIAWPQAEVTLIEPLTRRFNFLNLATLKLGLRGLKVLRQSATGHAPEGLAPFDAVIERAVAALPEALRLTLPLAAAGGLALAYQSAPADENDPALKKILAAQRARLVESWPYQLPQEGRQRFLAVFEKERD